MPEVVLPNIELVSVETLRHIEGFSERRVRWLVCKILDAGLWTNPVVLEADYDLVLDGQHRVEAAKMLNLRRVPAVRFTYGEVQIWSLRPNHKFDRRRVIERALANEPYPYKTVKHRFPVDVLPACSVSLDELR